jgi:hypothetical protein
LGMPKGYDSTKLFAAVRKGMNLWNLHRFTS